MEHTLPDRRHSVFVVINPVAGNASAADIRRVLTRQFDNQHWIYEWYETTGDEHIPGIVRNAVRRGFTMVVAAGGDGTISSVSNGLIYNQVPLGILPVGTANVLAQELDIPQNLTQAAALLTGEHTIRVIDAMRVANRFFVQQIGVGIDALAIRDTSRKHKRIFGTLAYLWSGARNIAGFQPQHFTIVADGHYIRKWASQVIIANGSLMGTKFLRWGTDIHLDDKHVMVCIVSARTGLDYLELAWHFVRHQHGRSRGVHYVNAQHFVSVDADHGLPVQADGEIIRQTPVRVQIIPHAVEIIVPVSPP